MGIQDRDYMKQPPGDDARRRSKPGGNGWHISTTEEFLEAFLERHPHFFTWLTIGLALLVLGMLVLLNLSVGRP
jgi:hypothetical protein